MRFAVYSYPDSDATKHADRWAVVLDHEHIMCVGTYQDCESWLDRHEMCERSTDSRRLTHNTSSASVLQRVRNGLQSLLVRSRTDVSTMTCPQSSVAVATKTLERWGCAIRSFLKGEAGCAEAAELLAVALVVGTMSVATSTVSLMAAFDRTVAYRLISKDVLYARTAGGSTLEKMRHETDGLEITCDLAESNR